MRRLFYDTSQLLKTNRKNFFILFFKDLIVIFMIILGVTACEKPTVKKNKGHSKYVKIVQIKKNTQQKLMDVKKNKRNNKKIVQAKKNTQQKFVLTKKKIHNKKVAQVEKSAQQKLVDGLINKLYTKDRQQQHIAIVQLGNIGSNAHRAIPDLIKILHSNYGLEARVVEALGKIGEKAILALVTLFSSENKKTRKYSVDAIIKQGNKALVAVMARKIEKNPNVKVCIAQTLAKLGKDLFSVPQLISLLQEKNQEVKIAAIASLGKRKSKLALPQLIVELNNDDSRVRTSAIKTIGQIGSSAKEAIPDLIKVLGNIGTGYVAISLMQIGDASIPFLQKALSHTDPKIRKDAARILGRIGLKARIALPELIIALNDKSPSVRISAAFGIKRIGTYVSGVIPALVKNLFDSVYPVRRSAAETLIAIGKDAKAIMPALIQNLKQEKNDIRSDTLYVLKAIGKDAKSAVPALIELLNYDLLKKEEIIETLNIIEPLWHQKYKKKIPIFVKKGINVDISCPGRASAGKRIRVTIVVTNTSNINLTGVTIHGNLISTTLSPFPLKILNGNNNPYIFDRSITWHVGNLLAGQVIKYNAIIVSFCKTCFRVTVNTDQGIRKEAECCIMSACGFPILLECIDTFDSLIIGEETTYIIEVTNQNRSLEYNVKIEVVFPVEISPISASGDTKCIVSGKRVTVISFPILDYQQKIQWKIRAKAMETGNARLKIYLTSERLKKPVTEEENTHVY